MNQKLSIIITGSLTLLLSCSTHAENNASLIKSAIATYNQRIADIPKLRRAAETGDREVQFYLAEVLRTDSSHTSSEAHEWYVKSANQGDMYSMFRLSRLNFDTCKIMESCPPNSVSPEEWRATLLKTAQEKSQAGDGEGMEMMYTITGDLDWLVKSAAAGYPSAQWWLANRYVDGDGWFFWPGQRKKEVESLYQASAEGGYPPAISEYAGILLQSGDIDGAQRWLLKGVSTGYVHAVGTYAYSLQYGKHYHFKQDLQLAYTLNLILSEIGGGTRDTSRYLLNKLKPQLTPEQLSAANQQASTWKATHPPVSYFPPKLEFH